MDLPRANPAWESDMSVINWSPLSQSVSGLKQSLISASLPLIESSDPQPPRWQGVTVCFQAIRLGSNLSSLPPTPPFIISPLEGTRGVANFRNFRITDFTTLLTVLPTPIWWPNIQLQKTQVTDGNGNSLKLNSAYAVKLKNRKMWFIKCVVFAPPLPFH